MRRATAEQSRTAGQINESTRESTEIVEEIDKTTKRDAGESALIVKAMERPSRSVRRISPGELKR